MTFKDNWEKTNQRFNVPETLIPSIVNHALPKERLTRYTIIAGGCANLNIKLQLGGQATPLLLRLYLREKEAAYREQKLGQLLQSILPVPQVYHLGQMGDYCFAIQNFIPGVPLRTLLLNYPALSWGPVMHQVGELLALLQDHTFPQAGFLNKDLIPTPFPDLKEFVYTCLGHSQVQQVLSLKVQSTIAKLYDTYGKLLIPEAPFTLAHGDFDPANILVEEQNNGWKVTGILDWEFAHSGSWVIDVANMLRYAHQMPITFQENFLKGLQSQGVHLPAEWRTITHLFNLSSLLDSLTRHPLSECPNIRNDCCQVIKHILQDLKT